MVYQMVDDFRPNRRRCAPPNWVVYYSQPSISGMDQTARASHAGPVTTKMCKVALGGWSLQRSASRSRQFGQLTPKADFSAVLRTLAAGEGIVSFEGAIVLDA
jgi:hypothetical protein